MLRSHIQRYIIKEVLTPTLICLLIFTMVLLVGRLMKLVDLVVNKGVSITDILILFGTLLPSFLNVSMPLAFLMGIMVGVGRMSADSETVALKAAGIGLGGVAKPIVALALLCSILTGIAGIWLKPWGYHAFRNQIFEIAEKKVTVGLQPQVFQDQFENIVLYANKLNNRTGQMAGLFIVEQSQDATSTIFAKSGNIITDSENETITFRLQQGVIHRQQHGADDSYHLIHFTNYDVQPDLGSFEEQESKSGAKKKMRPKEITTSELWASIRSGVDHDQIHAFRAELHSRLCSPFAPLLFALFGLPFSIQTHRSGRSGGFVVGLFIYLIYYLQLSLAETMSTESGLSPIWSFWTPHLLLFAAGFYCLRQSAREKTNLIVACIEWSILTIKAKFRT